MSNRHRAHTQQRHAPAPKPQPQPQAAQAPAPVAPSFVAATGFVENCDRSNLDFMGRFLPPRKGFALHRSAEGAFTVQFGDADPVPLPEHDLANLRRWRNAPHPQVRITGVGDGARLLDAPVDTAPVAPTTTAAGMSW